MVRLLAVAIGQFGLCGWVVAPHDCGGGALAHAARGFCGFPPRISMSKASKKDAHVVFTSQQIEVVQLVAILHDVALDLGRVHPSHEIFHVPTS